MTLAKGLGDESGPSAEAPSTKLRLLQSCVSPLFSSVSFRGPYRGALAVSSLYRGGG